MINIQKKIFRDIRKVCKYKYNSLHEPNFSNLEKEHLRKCIDSSYVSTFGPEISKFEKNLNRFTNAKNSVAVINATSGLFLSLKALGINSSHEVLVPALTFIGTVNAISYTGAIPHFIDVSKNFNDIDYKQLEIYLDKITYKKKNNLINKKNNKIIKCIIPVHLFGHPSDMEQCLYIAKKYKLKIVEDCAESLGSVFKKKHTGLYGDCGVISFNGNKIITTGGGGVILTNSKKIAKKISHLASTSKVIKKFEITHDEIGYNFRLPNLNSALGVAQMKKLKIFVKLKRKLFYRYSLALKNNPYVELMKEPKNCKSNYWLQTIILKKKFMKFKNKILIYLNKKKIFARPVWRLIHQLPPYKKCNKMALKNSVEASKRLIHLPSGTQL